MKRSKHWVLVGLALLVMAGLLIRSIRTNPHWRAFNTRTFLDSLVTVDKAWIAWALVSIYATYVVRALRWKVLMAHTKPNASLRNLLSATIVGFGAIGVFGRAGEMVRPYLVSRKEGVPMSSQVAVWVLERSFDTLTILVTVAFALRNFEAAGLRSSPTLSKLLHVSGNVVSFTTVAVLLLMLLLRNFTEPIMDWVLRRLQFLAPHRFAKVEQSLLDFVHGSRGIRNVRTLAACVLYSAAEWTLIAFCYSAVFNAFSGGMRLSASQVLIYMGGVMAGCFVQIPGIGGGIQLASLLILTEAFDITPEVAASISLLTWVFTFLAVVPLAIGVALHEGLSWNKLRKLEPET